MEGNLYKRWMEDYSGPDFLGAVNRGIGTYKYDLPVPYSHVHNMMTPSQANENPVRGAVAVLLGSGAD